MRKSVHPGDLPVTDATGCDSDRTIRRDRVAATRAACSAEDSAALKVPADGGQPHASPGLDDEATLNDARLVELARHGDHGAFEVLVRRYERKLVRVLARLVRDPETARDLAQETFWRVYSRLERFDTARRF